MNAGACACTGSATAGSAGVGAAAAGSTVAGSDAVGSAGVGPMTVGRAGRAGEPSARWRGAASISVGCAWRAGCARGCSTRSLEATGAVLEREACGEATGVLGASAGAAPGDATGALGATAVWSPLASGPGVRFPAAAIGRCRPSAAPPSEAVSGAEFAARGARSAATGMVGERSDGDGNGVETCAGAGSEAADHDATGACRGERGAGAASTATWA
jgi:hypothetical protein